MRVVVDSKTKFFQADYKNCEYMDFINNGYIMNQD